MVKIANPTLTPATLLPRPEDEKFLANALDQVEPTIQAGMNGQFVDSLLHSPLGNILGREKSTLEEHIAELSESDSNSDSAPVSAP
jgi:hypothetical protein